jgi:hypothetical protein
MRFSGRAELSDGERHDVEIGVGAPGVSLLVGGVEVGSWSSEECRLIEVGSDEYRVEIEDDYFLFTPAEPERFRHEAGPPRTAGGTLEVAVADSPAHEPPPEPVGGGGTRSVGGDTEIPPGTDPRPARSGVTPWIVGAGAAAVVAVLVVVALSLRGDGDSGEGVLLTTTSTAAVEATISVFDGAPAAFVTSWNATSQALGASLPVTAGPGAFEHEFSPVLRLEWETGGGGVLAGYQVVVDTTGTGESGRVALAALGVAIAVADPTLDAAGRRAVLTTLGYDVTNPVLAAMDGDTEANGVRYSLRYVPEFSTLLFSVRPVDS